MLSLPTSFLPTLLSHPSLQLFRLFLWTGTCKAYQQCAPDSMWVHLSASILPMAKVLISAEPRPQLSSHCNTLPWAHVIFCFNWILFSDGHCITVYSTDFWDSPSFRLLISIYMSWAHFSPILSLPNSLISPITITALLVHMPSDPTHSAQLESWNHLCPWYPIHPFL